MSTFSRSGALPRIPLGPGSGASIGSLGAPSPVRSLEYREMTSLPPLTRVRVTVQPEPEPRKRAEVEMTEAELQALLAEARREAAAAAEARVREEARARLEAEAARITGALDHFERERKGYFAKVEIDVVRLALSIAAKILHREAQVDPMLVAALVQIAVNQLKENTAVSIRVHPAAAARWRTHFERAPQWAAVMVVEDEALEVGDCYLETELGTANFSLAAQLKEVEQGFFDVLAQTPRA